MLEIGEEVEFQRPPGCEMKAVVESISVRSDFWSYGDIPQMRAVVGLQCVSERCKLEGNTRTWISVRANANITLCEKLRSSVEALLPYYCKRIISPDS